VELFKPEGSILYVIKSRKRCDMAKIQENKLDQLRRDIREGLESGDPAPWDMDDFLQEARRRRLAAKKSDPEIKKASPLQEDLPFFRQI